MTQAGPIGLRFHHHGLAVVDDTTALTFLRLLGYTPGERVHDPIQNVTVRLCTSPNHPTVEIVQPGPDGPSPVDALLRRNPSSLYHTCYETPDLGVTMAILEEAGLAPFALTERAPAVLFGGRHVSFYQVAGWGMIELLEDS